MKTEELILRTLLEDKARERWTRHLLEMFHKYGEPGLFSWNKIRSTSDAISVQNLAREIYEYKTSPITIDESSCFKRSKAHKKKTIKTEAKKILTSPLSKSFVPKHKPNVRGSFKRKFLT